MRFYHDFPEAINELRRELKEMGVRIHTKSVQNKDISDKPEFMTLELQNYTYTVTNPDPKQIVLANENWAWTELAERCAGVPQNPGAAWKLRQSTWEPFLKPDGTFDYAYPDRMANPLWDAIRALRQDLYTRRAFVAVFDRQIDDTSNFGARIPCTLGYWLNYRQGQLHITYLQRSSDFYEHFNYDIWLAESTKKFVASQLSVEPGNFTHWIGSFHVFEKDVQGVF